MRRQKIAALFVGALAVWPCLVLSACGPTTWQGAVIRTADAVRAATVKTIPPLMAKGAGEDEKKCEAAHPEGSPERKACIQKIIKRLRAWHFARAAMQAVVVALKNMYDVDKGAASPQPPRTTTPRPAPAPARR